MAHQTYPLMNMKQITSSNLLLLLYLFCMSCGSPGSPEQDLPPAAKVTVNTASQLVSIDVTNAPLAAVLTEMGRHAHLTVSVPDELKSERLTLAFHDLPLEAALKQVLARQSYVFLYTRTRGSEVIAGVRLFARHEQAPSADIASPVAQGTRSPPANQSPSTMASSWGRASLAPEMTTPALSEDVPVGELQRSLSEAQDPAVRLATLEALADREAEGPVIPLLANALADSDEGVRETALNLLKSSYDPLPIGPLASMATSDANPEFRSEALTLMTDQLMMQDRPKEDWAAVTATLTRGLSDPDPDIRDQATTLLAEVSQPAPPTSKWGPRR
jgi:HEAT repeat protein